MEKDKANTTPKEEERVANEGLKAQPRATETKGKAKAKAKQRRIAEPGLTEIAQEARIVGIGTRQIAEIGKQDIAQNDKLVDFFTQLKQHQHYHQLKSSQIQRRDQEETMPWP